MQHKITSTLIGLSLSALALSGCAAAPAAGAEGLRLTTDLQQEVQHTAEVPAEMSEEEAAAFDELAKLQEPLSVAVGAIEEQFPDDLSYTFFDDETLTVAFKSAAPADAVALLTATGGSYVVLESVGYDADEYQAAVDSVVQQTEEFAMEDRVVSVGSQPHLEPGAIVVSFHSEDKGLTADPGLADSLDVDPRFRVIFDFTNTDAIEAFNVVE
jgi:hypothetical protein